MAEHKKETYERRMRFSIQKLIIKARKGGNEQIPSLQRRRLAFQKYKSIPTIVRLTTGTRISVQYNTLDLSSNRINP